MYNTSEGGRKKKYLVDGRHLCLFMEKQKEVTVLPNLQRGQKPSISVPPTKERRGGGE